MKIYKKVLGFLFVLVVSIMAFYSISFAAEENIWTTKVSMSHARSNFQVAVVNGKIYAIGGRNASGYINSVEEYDPVTNTWKEKATMNKARCDHRVAVVNGKIYAIGGRSSSSVGLNTVEEYDPVTNIWTTKAAMKIGRYEHKVAVVNGKIYVINGIGGTNNDYLNSVEEYDPITNKWTTKTSMSNFRRTGFQVAVVNGKIYTIGGKNQGSYINSVEEYDPVTNIWTTKEGIQKCDHNEVVVNGKIYVIGGVYNGMLNSVEEYDPVINTWTTKAPMNIERASPLVAIVNGKVYVIGGVNISGSLNSVEEYDPITNKWTTKASMNTIRYYYEVAVLNEKIYAIGGLKGSDFLNLVEEYTPTETPYATQLTASKGDAYVNLSWSSVPDATNYYIKRSTTVGGPYTTIASISTTTYTDITVVNGTTYYYVVSAVNEGGESANSNEVYAKPMNTPKAPTNLTTQAGISKVDLSWSSVPDATSYYIKRSTTAGGPYTTIATGSTTTYTDITVVNGTTYYYVVSAVNEGGESANSNEVSAVGSVIPLNNIQATSTGIAYTIDGIVWKSVFICDEFKGYVYDSFNNIFIGVGNYFTEGSLDTYYFGGVFTSKDGITWEKGNCPSSYNLYSIATDGKGTVVIGGGYDGNYGIETHVYTTNNGSATWAETIKGYCSKKDYTYRTGVFIGIVQSVIYTNNKFTVIGKNYNETYTKYSNDGYTWY